MKSARSSWGRISSMNEITDDWREKSEGNISEKNDYLIMGVPSCKFGQPYFPASVPLAVVF